jgi:membrane-associated phospholipid phosphatase
MGSVRHPGGAPPPPSDSRPFLLKYRLMTESSQEAANRPNVVARWLSPEGYLGLHLLLGFLVAFLAGAAFSNVAEEVFESEAALAVDDAARDFARAIHAPWLTAVMHFASFVGAQWPLTVLTATVLVWLALAHARRRLVMFAAVMCIGPVLNGLLKEYFKRARPSGWDEMLASGYSFPSGHSMGSMLFFGALAYVLYFTAGRHHVVRILAVVACFSAAFVIGGSRVYLGVHYFSDVIAGFAAGLCWIGICVSAVEGWIKLREWRAARRMRRSPLAATPES